MRNIKTDVVHDAFFQYVSLFGAYSVTIRIEKMKGREPRLLAVHAPSLVMTYLLHFFCPW